MVCELYLLTNAGGQAGQKQTNKKAVLSPPTSHSPIYIMQQNEQNLPRGRRPRTSAPGSGTTGSYQASQGRGRVARIQQHPGRAGLCRVSASEHSNAGQQPGPVCLPTSAPPCPLSPTPARRQALGPLTLSCSCDSAPKAWGGARRELQSTQSTWPPGSSGVP